MLAPWKESYEQPRQHIKKQRHYFANKGPSSDPCGLCLSRGFLPVALNPPPYKDTLFQCDLTVIASARIHKSGAISTSFWRHSSIPQNAEAAPPRAGPLLVGCHPGHRARSRPRCDPGAHPCRPGRRQKAWLLEKRDGHTRATDGQTEGHGKRS